MNNSPRLSAFLAYIPVIGWLYVFLFARKSKLAFFHLRQSIGLALFLVAAVVVWFAAVWVISWIPYLFFIAMALFALVITAYLYGVVAWVQGMRNALQQNYTSLGLFGDYANRLPIEAS